MSFGLALLRSFSAIFFQNNEIFALLIVIGLLVASPITLATAAIGALTSNLVSLYLGADKSNFVQGLYGFNGLLVGAAAAFYFKDLIPSVVVTIIGAILATFIYHLLLKNNIQPFALPFVVVTLGIILLKGVIK